VEVFDERRSIQQLRRNLRIDSATTKAKATHTQRIHTEGRSLGTQNPIVRSAARTDSDGNVLSGSQQLLVKEAAKESTSVVQRPKTEVSAQ
jgi:hypothetical protein